MALPGLHRSALQGHRRLARLAHRHSMLRVRHRCRHRKCPRIRRFSSEVTSGLCCGKPRRSIGTSLSMLKTPEALEKVEFCHPAAVTNVGAIRGWRGVWDCRITRGGGGRRPGSPSLPMGLHWQCNGRCCDVAQHPTWRFQNWMQGVTSPFGVPDTSSPVGLGPGFWVVSVFCKSIWRTFMPGPAATTTVAAGKVKPIGAEGWIGTPLSCTVAELSATICNVLVSVPH